MSGKRVVVQLDPSAWRSAVGWITPSFPRGAHGNRWVHFANETHAAHHDDLSIP